MGSLEPILVSDQFMPPSHLTYKLIPHPHLLVPCHQRTVSTSKGCNQWLSLAKTLLKVALAGGNRLLKARPGKCGWAISLQVRLKKHGLHTSHAI